MDDLFSNKGASINTKYLIDAPPSKPFPWIALLILIFFFSLTFLGTWMLYEKRKNRNIVIHHVSKGETLASLAIRYYGNSKDLQRIFAANRKKLMNQNELKEGDKIIIPLITSTSTRRP